MDCKINKWNKQKHLAFASDICIIKHTQTIKLFTIKANCHNARLQDTMQGKGNNPSPRRKKTMKITIIRIDFKQNALKSTKYKANKIVPRGTMANKMFHVEHLKNKVDKDFYI